MVRVAGPKLFRPYNGCFANFLLTAKSASASATSSSCSLGRMHFSVQRPVNYRVGTFVRVPERPPDLCVLCAKTTRDQCSILPRH